jgi:uncharacterized caspase-like protein
MSRSETAMKRPFHLSFALVLAACAALAAGPRAHAAQGLPELLRSADGGEVRALIIGIDAYRHVRQLKGAVADARDIEGALHKMGVRDVTTLTDNEVDRATVLRDIARLTERAKPGDLVVLSLAGHGAQEPERVKGSQPDGMDDIFLLTGFDLSGPATRERIIGSEFNTLIKRIEARGAKVLFVADTCHGGGLAREVDPRAAEMSYREVPRYRLVEDELKPIATPADAFLTPLDFQKTAFLAAVDRQTKSPEVKIPGIPGYRGALSYAVARAFEGQADKNHDGQVTLKELFTNVRQVVYQLSDQRQNPVTESSPNRNINTDVAFRTRGVTLVSAVPNSPQRPTPAERPQPTGPLSTQNLMAPGAVSPVRIAALDGQPDKLRTLTVLEAPFQVVTPAEQPDLIWDPKTGDVIAGGDVIAYHTDKSDLPNIIDRAAAVRGFKQLAAKLPQGLKLSPNDKLHHNDAKLDVEISDLTGRALILFNIAGDGTVQPLYPIGSDPPIVTLPDHHLKVRVREPFGADQVIAITADRRMSALEQALKQMSQRRASVQMLKLVERYAPADARIGTIGLYTAP